MAFELTFLLSFGSQVNQIGKTEYCLFYSVRRYELQFLELI